MGLLWASKPLGLHTITNTIAKPNTSIRYSENSRKASGSKIIAAAANTTPTWLPMPPSTTIDRMIADSMKVKLSGLIKPFRLAKNEPAKPPNIAPNANADNFVLTGLIPRERQAISSSLSASHALPMGNFRIRSTKKPSKCRKIDRVRESRVDVVTRNRSGYRF